MSSAPSGGQAARQCQGGQSVAADGGDPAGQRADHRERRCRMRAALASAAVHQPQHALVAAVGGPARHRGGHRRRQRGRSGSGRSIIRADCVNRARCASSRHGRPSRTSSDSKTPSPRTTARSSACSSGVCGSCNCPSSVTTTPGSLAMGKKRSAVELTYVSSSRPRHGTRRRRRLALRRPARRAARGGGRGRGGGPLASGGAHADRRRAARLAAQHLHPARQRPARRRGHAESEPRRPGPCRRSLDPDRARRRHLPRHRAVARRAAAGLPAQDGVLVRRRRGAGRPGGAVAARPAAGRRRGARGARTGLAAG